MARISPGKKVPAFSLPATGDKEISLADCKGKNLVLYFYPKDDTPGCTAEACNLRDNFSVLKDKGFALLGVSPDSSKKHQKFIDKYKSLITEVLAA